MEMNGRITRVEVMALSAVAFVLLGVFSNRLAAVNPHCHAGSKVAQCASRLQSMGVAMYIYAQDDPSVFPALALVRTQDDGLMQIFDPDDRIFEPLTTNVPSPTVDLWHLVRVNYATPTHFICPVTDDVPDPAQDTSAYYDFLGPANLSYAYQFQHDPDRRMVGTSSHPNFPVLADGNPYIKGGINKNILKDRKSGKKGNSANHKNRKKGQNVLFVDGSVSLETTPAVGPFGPTHPQLDSNFDNIYTVHEFGGFVDPGSAKPTAEWCNLGSQSDACLVP